MHSLMQMIIVMQLYLSRMVTHLQINFIRSTDGGILDSSTLVKDHTNAFVVQQLFYNIVKTQ